MDEFNKRLGQMKRTSELENQKKYNTKNMEI